MKDIDWDTRPLPETREDCLEEIVMIQRRLHGDANRLAAIAGRLERLPE